MNCFIKYLIFSFIASVQAQTDLQIQAAGSVPSGSAGTAQGQGQGADVTGEAIVQVTDNSVLSSTVIQATGPSRPAPRPTPKPAPRPVPKPAPKTTIVTKQYASPKPVCSDITDKQCPKIDTFKSCGFCVVKSYPIKGYACDYEQRLVLNNKNNYDVVIVPLCKCDGNFIIEGKACPSCDKILNALLKCAGSNKNSGTIEIPEKCLKQVGATKKILNDCGFFGASPKQVVLVEEKRKPVIIVEPKQYQVVVPSTTIVVPAGGTATASSTASTVIGTSAAQSTSSAIGASVNAVAAATSFGR